MWRHFMFTFIWFMHCKCQTLHCPAGLEFHEDEVYRGRNYWTGNASNFSWSGLDARAGRVTLEFDMSRNFGVGKSNVFLEVLESASEAECDGADLGSSVLSQEECSRERRGFQRHSTRSARVKRNGDDPHDQVKRNMTFNMVYRGCYRVVVKPDTGRLRNPSFCSPPIFLLTNFTKEKLFNVKDLNVVTRYDYSFNVMRHAVTNIGKLHISKMKLTVRKCEEDCNCTSGKKEEWWIISLNAAGEFVCKQRDTSSNCKVAAGESGCKQKEESSTCKVSHGGQEIVCSTENSANKSQCLLVELLNDHPCNGIGVWKDIYINKSCTWNSHTVKPLIVPVNTTSIDEDYSLVFIIAAILCCLLVLCIAALLYILKGLGRGQLVPILPPQPSPPFSIVMPQIILLYSRDCKAFMDLMATFRTLLENALKCQVHDCYDPDIAEDVATGSLEWMTKYLTRDNVKIILVESECAILRQKALFQGVQIVYKDPSWLDAVFLHGLKDLANDRRKNQYDRVFVVRINGFTDENERIRIINPNTRYTIPQYLDDLITGLCRQKKSSYSEDLHRLDQDIKSLERYRRNNINYLDQLLRRS